MKTTRMLLLSATFVLFPWLLGTVSAQQNDVKKIVITKKVVDADGSKSSETIVKKGSAAENFDVDKYISENRDDNTYIKVEVSGGGEERTIVIKGNKADRDDDERTYMRSRGADNDEDDEDEEEDEDDAEGGSVFNFGFSSCNNSETFLGVDEDSDEDPAKPGLVVNVVRGSAADLAGLHDNDKIMKLNDTPINQWSDLSTFVNAAKPGDKVRIAYERNGKAATTEATLTKRSDVKCNTKCEAIGFLGVSNEEEEDEESEPGVAVSITKGSGAEKAGLKNGDAIFQLNDTPIADFEDISDFMAYTKPGDKVQVVYERNGKRNTVEVTLSEPINTWNFGNFNVDMGDWNKGNWSNGDGVFNVKAKDACIGVFSDPFNDDDVAGAQINDFTDNSAARDAEMQKGDVITSINGVRVEDHNDLWDEIARYKIGDKVKVEYQRNGKTASIDIELRACSDNSSRIQIFDNDGQSVRNFMSWNWNEDDQRRLRERSIITIRKGEGDAPKVNQPPVGDRSLKLVSFRAFPNPTQGQITVEFKGEPVATTVSFFDLSGRQLFREELNAFNGEYSQEFDLSAYAKGTIVVHIQQGDKIFTEQVVVN